MNVQIYSPTLPAKKRRGGGRSAIIMLIHISALAPLLLAVCVCVCIIVYVYTFAQCLHLVHNFQTHKPLLTIPSARAPPPPSPHQNAAPSCHFAVSG